jgi:hypothetical protein
LTTGGYLRIVLPTTGGHLHIYPETVSILAPSSHRNRRDLSRK